MDVHELWHTLKARGNRGKLEGVHSSPYIRAKRSCLGWTVCTECDRAETLQRSGGQHCACLCRAHMNMEFTEQQSGMLLHAFWCFLFMWSYWIHPSKYTYLQFSVLVLFRGKIVLLDTWKQQVILWDCPVWFVTAWRTRGEPLHRIYHCILYPP